MILYSGFFLIAFSFPLCYNEHRTQYLLLRFVPSPCSVWYTEQGIFLLFIGL
nr:MAG TPA: hypothetical protein [Caudoviricetes sp.]